MPLYEYKCKKCGSLVEVIQKVSDKPLDKCDDCGGVLEKVISCPAIQFKGSGWYVTDYGKKDIKKDIKKEKTKLKEKPKKDKSSLEKKLEKEKEIQSTSPG